MKTRTRQLKNLLPLLIAALPLSAHAQDPIVYPAKGQSSQQMAQDRFECHTWAVQQSGFDPSTGASASQPGQPQERKGKELLRGGARGAAAGAAIGAIAGDAGKGAAIGAAAGGLKRGFAQRDADKAAAAAPNEAAVNYNRALTACLTGRGYTVQ
jgi:hypothetical protein